MKQELICIVCPNGCTLSVERQGGSILVSGNRCKRGEAFAKSELTAPMRTLCSTVRTSFPALPVLPVRTAGEIPKARMMDVMQELNNVTVSAPVCRGDVIIHDVLGLGCDIIASSSILASIYGGTI